MHGLTLCVYVCVTVCVCVCRRSASKPAPVVTQEHTTSLEELICRRIKDGAFDDVLPPDQQPRPRKDAGDAELSQEKSSRGLGEVTRPDLT